jgi:aspartyl/glutamyl-tRNA(Asn/Gln) amidotransferase C subunit
MTKAKTKITAEEVRRLGELSRLAMSPSEEEALREQLSSIIDYFRVVDGVEDSFRIDRTTVEASDLREDEVGPSDPEGVLRGVPQKKGRLVKAPRVF